MSKLNLKPPDWAKTTDEKKWLAKLLEWIIIMDNYKIAY